MEIFSAALNPADYNRFEGVFGHLLRFTNPNATPGLEFFGRVVVPAKSSELEAGQLLFGVTNPSPCSKQGSLREYALVETIFSAAVPPALLSDQPERVLGITVTGATAFQALQLNSNHRKVFINGGSGGVGLMCVQIAKIHGMHVTATCSTSNIKLLKDLGVDLVVDYTTTDVLEQLMKEGGYDQVVDNVGNDWELYRPGHEYMNDHAIYTMVASGGLGHNLNCTYYSLRPWFLGGGRRSLRLFSGEAKIADAMKVVDWLVEGKVKVMVDSRYRFEDVAAAFARLKSKRA